MVTGILTWGCITGLHAGSILMWVTFEIQPSPVKVSVYLASGSFMMLLMHFMRFNLVIVFTSLVPRLSPSYLFYTHDFIYAKLLWEERREGESLGGFNHMRTLMTRMVSTAGHFASGSRAHASLNFHSRSVTPIDIGWPHGLFPLRSIALRRFIERLMLAPWTSDRSR